MLKKYKVIESVEKTILFKTYNVENFVKRLDLGVLQVKSYFRRSYKINSGEINSTLRPICLGVKKWEIPNFQPMRRGLPEKMAVIGDASVKDYQTVGYV